MLSGKFAYIIFDKVIDIKKVGYDNNVCEIFGIPLIN